MRFRNMKAWTAGTLLAMAGIYGASRFLIAEEPRSPAATQRVRGKDAIRSGTVREFLKSDHGDIDGLQLDEGSDIHFPPHIGREVRVAVKIGDTVTVEGRSETLPRGEAVFEATKITGGGRSVVVDRPAPPRGPKSRHDDDTPMNANGTVKELVRNPHGDIDGFLLDDDTEVKIPPHQGDELSEFVGEGDKVRIEGRRHETPLGEIHLHADRITAVASGRTLERDEPAGARPEPRLARRGPKPIGPKEVDPRGIGPQDELAGRAPTNEEIMRELRELRRLIEARK